MSQDEINIDLTSDISEGEAAKRKLLEIAAAVVDLNRSFDSGNTKLADYRAELRSLEKQANSAQRALDDFNDAQVKAGKQRLEGSDRAGAKARLGLAAANIAQDVAQGGPASAINNILGLAGDTKIRALVGEFVAGAGGISGIAAKLGAAGAAFAALFLTVQQGLKSAKLGWSDLDDVAGNLAPIRALREAWDGLMVAARESGLSTIVDDAFKGLSGGVGTLAEATIGWDSATAAARAHKEEVEGSVRAARDYAQAVKDLAGVQSDAQKDRAERGQAFAKALADAGGAGGIPGLVDSLARTETMRTGGEKVEVAAIDDKGQPTGKREEITRAEQARRRLMIDANRARAGDAAAMGRLMDQAAAAGVDVKGLRGAAAGVDPKAEASAANRDLAERVREADRDAEAKSREFEKRTGELAKPLQERFDLTSASGGVVTEGQVRRKLAEGGLDDAEAGRYAKAVLEDLEHHFQDAMRERAGRLGTDAAGAKGSLLDEAALKAERDRDAARKRLGIDAAESRSVQVYSGASALRDAIQQSIKGDNTPKESLRAQQEARDEIRKSNELLQQIAGRVGGPARAG